MDAKLISVIDKIIHANPEIQVKEPKMAFSPYATPKKVLFTLNAMSKVNKSRRERGKEKNSNQKLKKFLAN